MYDAGLSVVTVTAGDTQSAKTICQHLAREAWERREEFVYHPEPLVESIRRASQMKNGPILLIDHADNCASGGTQDTMAVVAEVIRQGLQNVAIGAIRDPEAVAALIDSGLSSTISVQLGERWICRPLG